MHAGPHHCVRTRWEGPTGAGGRRMVVCDMTHIMNHVHAHLVGLERASRSLNFLHLLTYYDYDNSCDATFISVYRNVEVKRRYWAG